MTRDRMCAGGLRGWPRLTQGGAYREAEAAGRILMNQGTETPAHLQLRSQGSRVSGAVARVLTFAVDVQVGPVVPEHRLHQLRHPRCWGRRAAVSREPSGHPPAAPSPGVTTERG